MQFGRIGLGRMGANRVRRLMRNGHTGVVYDRSQPAVDTLVKEGGHRRGLDEFQNKVRSAMRFGFGGHVEKR